MKTPLMSSKSGGKAPQCRVCGDESSGFHYGVDSCEGCKGFFRRCITQGMNHKCANEEKCEITPFTRNSCQYCRLKKCFEVGMSREASRLGRRPKRLKEVGGGEGGGSSGARVHVGNVPIAPYPSQQDLHKMRMTELHKILHSNNGSFKEEHMQAFLTAAKASFQEHSKTGATGSSGEGSSTCKRQVTASQQQQQLMNITCITTLTQNLVSNSVSSGGDAGGLSVVVSSAGGDSLMGGVSVDSPSSLHSPGGSLIDLSNLSALDSFLFEQGMPATPGGTGLGGLSNQQQVGMEIMGDLQAANSPFNLSNVSLDPVSSATSPLSDLCTTPSPHPGSVGGMGTSSTDMLSAMNGISDVLNQNMPSTSSGIPSSLQSQLLQYQQYQRALQQQQMAGASSPAMAGMMQVKTEPCSTPQSCFSPASVFVKMEPISPEPLQPCSSASSVCQAAGDGARANAASVLTLPPMPKYESKLFGRDPPPPDTNVAAIMEEVRQTPSETRRLLIEQVTDAVVEAHMTTTTTSSKAVEEANQRLGFNPNEMPDISRLTLNPNDIWQKFVSTMVPEITRVVKFCKKLPGFVEIEQDDQIVLIKQGAFEVMMTRFALLVDHEKQTMMDPSLSMKSPRNVIREMPMGEFLDEFFFVASQFNPLQLTDGEVGLFTSVLIICPARIGLKNRRAVGKIQSLFQQALYYLMKHNHKDPDQKFSQLMSLVSTFHRINDEHFKTLNNIRMGSHREIENQLPDLHKEIFNISYLGSSTQ